MRRVFQTIAQMRAARVYKILTYQTHQFIPRYVIQPAQPGSAHLPMRRVTAAEWKMAWHTSKCLSSRPLPGHQFLTHHHKLR